MISSIISSSSIDNGYLYVLSLFSLFCAVIFKSKCLFYQNKLSLRRREKSPHLLPALCLRERRRMKTITWPKITWWKLGTMVSWSVWWEDFTVLFFFVISCFVPAVSEMSRWVLKVTVESSSFRPPDVRSLWSGLMRRTACWGGRTWSSRLSATSKSSRDSFRQFVFEVIS